MHLWLCNGQSNFALKLRVQSNGTGDTTEVLQLAKNWTIGWILLASTKVDAWFAVFLCLVAVAVSNML